MKIEPGKKYRVKDVESSDLFLPKDDIYNGLIVETREISPYGTGNWMLANGYIIEPNCLELLVDHMQVIAENLWQTLCYVKQALDSGAPIDKEYIAKVLAENRPEEIEPLT